MPNDRAHAPDGNIYYPSGVKYYFNDFSIAPPEAQSIFIHELAHVWQEQSGKNVALLAFLNRDYNYGAIFQGQSYYSLGLEAQAQFIQEYFYIREYGSLQGRPSLAAYEAVLPQPLKKIYDEMKNDRLEFDELNQRCFTAGTLISTADGTQKPIETIQPDDMVLAFDPEVDAGRGGLVPSRVVRTFVNQNQTVIDFHGTGVTPGHAFLCGDGPHEGRFRQVMDIIRDDGAVVRDDGSLIRASTGCAVGSAGDSFIELQLAHPAREKARGREVILLKDRARVRAGTRVERPDGTSFSFLELIEENGWMLLENGFVGQGEGHEPEPLMWSGRTIPKPEDYILARSRLTLADLYDDPRELAMSSAPTGALTAQRDAPASKIQAGARQTFTDPAPAGPSTCPSRKVRRKAEAEQRKAGRVRKHAGMTVQ